MCDVTGDDMRKVLAEIKQIALTVQTNDVPNGLAHIIRLCIDADRALSRPDAGGGVREALQAALSCLDNSGSPGGCNGKHNDCEHCRAIAMVHAALSTPSDAVNESAEARLRGIVPLADHAEIGMMLVENVPHPVYAAIVTITTHCAALQDDPSPDKSFDIGGCISQECMTLAKVLSAGGDEAKKSEGETPPSDQTADRGEIVQAHDWIKSTLGHGESMCSRCMITNREAAVLGRLNVCSRPAALDGGAGA